MDIGSIKDAKALGELLDALTRLEKIDEEKAEHLDKELSQVELYKLTYQEQMALERKVRKRARRKPGRPKLHWKEKKRKVRESKANWYRRHQKPRDIEATLRSVEEGWYERVRLNWRKSKVPFRITREEWDEHIAPVLEGRVPYVVRVDAKADVSLSNIVVYDRVTNEVLFDSVQQKLVALGACCS